MKSYTGDVSATNNGVSRAGVLIALALATLVISGLRPTLAQVPDGEQPSNVQAPPAGFTTSPVASLTGEIVTDVAVVPDGRLLATTKSGRVRVMQSGALQPTPALDLNVSGGDLH